MAGESAKLMLMTKHRITGLPCCLLVLCVGLLPQPVLAEIYKWVDSEGHVHFSDQRAAPNRASPVQLKSSLNSYNGRSLPKLETTANNRPHQKRSKNKLPRLRPQQVIMYSTVWCGFCKKAKAYFKQKGISYSERDIEKSAQANQEYRSLGGGGVPLILVGNKAGTRKLSGFSIKRFDLAYR